MTPMALFASSVTMICRSPMVTNAVYAKLARCVWPIAKGAGSIRSRTVVAAVLVSIRSSQQRCMSSRWTFPQSAPVDSWTTGKTWCEVASTTSIACVTRISGSRLTSRRSDMMCRQVMSLLSSGGSDRKGMCRRWISAWYKPCVSNMLATTYATMVVSAIGDAKVMSPVISIITTDRKSTATRGRRRRGRSGGRPAGASRRVASGARTDPPAARQHRGGAAYGHRAVVDALDVEDGRDEAPEHRAC